jgi:hypothetical protein
MPVTCDIIVRWSATPKQLAALGIALWRWCNRTAGDTGSYQYLDNQALADLIAGKLPISCQPPLESDQRGVHLRVHDESSQDRLATIDGLRRELPAGAIDGISWNSVEAENHMSPTLGDTTAGRLAGASCTRASTESATSV